MKFTNSEVLNDLLEEIVKEVPVSVSFHDGGYFIDLNTGMKSEALMRIHHDEVELTGRYGDKVTISFLELYEGQIREELLSFVANCKCYREYATRGWWCIMENNRINLGNY